MTWKPLEMMLSVESKLLPLVPLSQLDWTIEFESMFTLGPIDIVLLTTKCNIFSSWVSVSDLLDYITPDADMKAREAQKKARAKVVNSCTWIYSHMLLLLAFSLC